MRCEALGQTADERAATQDAVRCGCADALQQKLYSGWYLTGVWQGSYVGVNLEKSWNL